MSFIHSIKFKIFLGILITLTVLIGGMVLSIQWRFERSFLNYVNTAQEEFQEQFIRELATLYKNERSWEALRDNRHRWRRLKIAALTASLPDEPDTGPPAATSSTPDKDFDSLPSRHEAGGGRFKKRFLLGMVALLDSERRLVVGHYRPGPEVKYKPVSVTGETVGYLAFLPLQRISDRHDLAFRHQLARAFYLIAGVMAVLAFLISLFLARPMLRRIQSLKQATQELGAGHYDIRLPLDSRDELGQLAADFNHLAVILSRNESARQQWIADISHELRTPITVLRGEIEALQDGVRQQTPQTLERLHGEVLNLERLVRDLYELSMSDIGALSYQKVRCDPVDVLQRSVAVFREEFAGKNIQLELNEVPAGPVSVLADVNRLQQLFSNLLLNSLRYTRAGGRLVIAVSREEQQLRIRFMDSAPGVSEADLPRLFERLFRVDSSRSRASGGAGLGLAICRNIVEAHEGSISAGASPLGGVQIDIVLPLIK